MNKLVIAILALLVPFTTYTVGCRQDSRQAAFPKGPEVKSLARGSTVEEMQPTVPMIPATIDPEVMQSPEQPTFARIRSVQDREARLAGQYNDAPGLFVLPAEGNDLASFMGPAMTAPSPAMAMSSPIYEPLHVIPIGNPGEEPLPEPVSMSAMAFSSAPEPSPAMQEIWSRPMTPMTSAYGFMPPPLDISTMAPPAAASIPLHTPDLAPQPASAPPNLGPDSMFMLEPIPGIFTGGGEGPTAFIAPKTFFESAGDINPPPLFSGVNLTAAPLPDPDKAAAEAAFFPIRNPAPMSSSNSETLSTLPARLKTEKASGFSEKVTALLINADSKQALAPLQPLGEPGEKKANLPSTDKAPGKMERSELGKPSTLSPILFEVQEDRNPSAEIFIPKPPSELLSHVASGAEAYDVYRMDFRNNQRPQVMPAEMELFDDGSSKSFRDFEIVKESRIEDRAKYALSDNGTVSAKASEVLGNAEKTEQSVTGTVEIAEAPQKITLIPLKSMPARALGLEKIDSSIDVPPVRF